MVFRLANLALHSFSTWEEHLSQTGGSVAMTTTLSVYSTVSCPVPSTLPPPSGRGCLVTRLHFQLLLVFSVCDHDYTQLIVTAMC